MTEQINKKIRVLYILNSTVMGGGNISFINLIKGLHEKNVDIYIVHPDKEIDSNFYDLTKDIVEKYYYVPLHAQVYEIGREKFTQTIKKWIKKFFKINKHRLARETSAIRSIIKQINPDLVHTNVGVIHSGYYASKAESIPHIWHLREYQTEDFGWEIQPSFGKFVTMLNDSNVITITKALLHYFMQDINEHAQCIYNGCFSYNDIANVYPKEKYFLCCSRIAPEKCYEEIIDAFSEFYKEKKDYRLVIAGYGEESYVHKLKERIIQLGCEKAVDFIGYISNVRSVMDKATALVVASRFEGFGRMTAEAAFRGCVVIGKNTGGTKEVINEIGGFPYEGGADQLLEKMREVSRLPEENYKLIIVKAQRQAQSLFSIERSVESIYRYYNKVLDNCQTYR